MSTIHLIRHAKAKNRAEWSEPDEARPLTKRGRREALALAERLADGHLGRLVSGPYVRCVQTLEPLALTTDLPIETTDLLAEGTAVSPPWHSWCPSPTTVRSRAARMATSSTR